VSPEAKLDVRDKENDLQQHNQGVLDEQKEHLSAVIDSGSEVVQDFLD
jgi:hypothetical protein